MTTYVTGGGGGVGEPQTHRLVTDGAVLTAGQPIQTVNGAEVLQAVLLRQNEHHCVMPVPTARVNLVTCQTHGSLRVIPGDMSEIRVNMNCKVQAPLYVTSRIVRTHSAGYPGCP